MSNRSHSDFSPLVDEVLINRFLKLAPENIRERCAQAAVEAAADPQAAQEWLAREGRLALQRERAQAQAAQALILTPPPSPAQSVQSDPVESSPMIETVKGAEVVGFLPRWPEEQRGAPNCLLRSALFSVVRRGVRAYLDNITVPVLGDVVLEYEGKRLDQADLDVMLHVWHLSQQQQSFRVRFGTREFLADIGRNSGKSDRLWLLSALNRLEHGSITYKQGKRSYRGGLINGVFRDEQGDGRYVIDINPTMHALFDDGDYTRLQYQQRGVIQLDLTKWLHAFYSTHAHPYPMKVDKVRGLCGSETGELWKFRQQLKAALAELSSVTGWNCWIDEKTDLCHIEKPKALSV